jgi:endonuclease YncB( thermonuclease family)
MIREGYAKPYERNTCEASPDYQQLNVKARISGKGFTRWQPVFKLL